MVSGEAIFRMKMEIYFGSFAARRRAIAPRLLDICERRITNNIVCMKVQKSVDYL